MSTLFSLILLICGNMLAQTNSYLMTVMLLLKVIGAYYHVLRQFFKFHHC